MNKPITYAYLETTNYCNLDCSFCNRKEVIGALQHMPLSKFRQMLENIKHHPIKEAKLMGMGEPMLHPQFDEICKSFKEYFPDAFLVVATNCQYPIRPDTKMGRKFKESMKYIDLLYFSIDGYKDSYERDRAPAKWDKLMSFLEHFKPMQRHGCRVTCNYVVNPENVYDIQTIKEEIVDVYELEELRLNIAQEWSEDKNMPGGYTQKDIKYLRDNWKDSLKGKEEWDFPDCFWVREGIYTTVEGHVKMCCLNTGAKPFGNLFDSTIEDIRDSKDFQAVQQGCATNNPTSHCSTCSYKELAPMLKLIKDE
jgi:MoaA/NifB/PqqE/SkfB family radical SAM enzyme